MSTAEAEKGLLMECISSARPAMKGARAALAGIALLFAPFAAVLGQGTAGPSTAGPGTFVPQVGQAGKDVIWVPTPETLVERMLSMAKVTPQDYVVDLGSGDGRTVIAAAKKFGANALGVEFNPDMVALSERGAAEAGVAERAKFVRGDIFQADFSKATVITMYLLPDLNVRLRPRLLQLKPGTRVVSHAFNMGDWEPDQRLEIDNRTALMWIVPARVSGGWRFKGPQGSFDADFKQTYQLLLGSAGGAAIEQGRLNGAAIAFSCSGTGCSSAGQLRRFSGQVSGDEIRGAFDDAAGSAWVATRR